MTPSEKIIGVLKRFARDERGSITLEFVIWLPFLLFWVVFSLGVFLAMDNRADAAKATYTISDIVSRYTTTLTRDDVDDLRALMNQLLPNSANGLMRISSIEFDQGSYTVQWTACFGNIPPMTNDEIPLNVVPQYMDNKDTVIVTETFTPYLPILVPVPSISGDRGYAVPNSLSWQIGVASRPRFVSKIEADAALSDVTTDCVFETP